MILLLLFLQKQSLAFAVYLFGIGTRHAGPGLKKKTHVIMLAGSATVDLQQHVWVTMQAVRARYPEAQGIVGGERERIRERIRKSRRVLQRKRDSHEESQRPISSMRCCNEGNTNFPVDTVLDRCQHGQRSKTRSPGGPRSGVYLHFGSSSLGRIPVPGSCPGVLRS